MSAASVGSVWLSAVARQVFFGAVVAMLLILLLKDRMTTAVFESSD
jgi:hypothetical protein